MLLIIKFSGLFSCVENFKNLKFFTVHNFTFKDSLSYHTHSWAHKKFIKTVPDVSIFSLNRCHILTEMPQKIYIMYTVISLYVQNMKRIPLSISHEGNFLSQIFFLHFFLLLLHVAHIINFKESETKKNSPTHISSRLINVITSKTQNEMKMNTFLSVFLMWGWVREVTKRKKGEKERATWAEYYALEV